MSGPENAIAGNGEQTWVGNQQINKMLITAQGLADSGRLKESEELCQHIITLIPNQAQAITILGVISHRKGYIEKARDLLQKADQLKPGNCIVTYNLGIVCMDLGREEEAFQFFEKTHGIDPGFTEPIMAMGVAMMNRKRWDEAHFYFDKVIALRPDAYEYWGNKGAAYELQQKWTEAAGCFEMCLNLALEKDPFLRKINIQITIARMQGEHYHSILKKFHQWLKPENYLEIGVASGATLALADPPTRSVGIDPEPHISTEFTAPTQVFSVTSDDFFASGKVKTLFRNQPIEFAFIDGLHIFEQVLKDFINVEQFAGRDSIILLHDTIPHDRQNASRDYKHFYWCGDVWKIVPCLKKYRPDLQVFTIPAKSTGLTAISKLDPSSTVLPDNFDQAVSDFIKLEYTDLVRDKAKILNIGPADWQSIIKRIQID